MEKTYQPQDIEKNWYQQWENQGFFKPSGQGEAYCIMIPPPNVTGSLHMGHAFQDTIMDCLIRYQRMTGKNTLWQAGTDHAGIATQMVVERNLADLEGISRHEIGREAFIDKIWQWKEESGGTITRQLRRMGSSIDWSRERFTMDEGFYRAVQEVFIQLFDENLIYRGKRLVNWDCKFRSAISDLEVENREQSGHLWHFRYPLTEGRLTQAGKNYITVATTRPETILGDSAVAVHPDDPRYQDLIGQFVELPLVGRKIPIIADTYVDPEFGSGCVKITPAHDFNDYDVGKRHALPLINILTQEGTIRDRAQIFHTDGNPDTQLDDRLPSAFHQLDRFAAREKIIADFEALGLLDHIDAHTLKVPYGDRSGVVIEPLLTDQWFVAVAELAKPAIEAVENGAIEFVPKQYENMYFAWMRDIQDWCISRQLWWGHRIPAWYDELGNVYVGRSEQAVREKYQLDVQLTLQQDEDVLDTWFSSGLWTFGTLGWPENTPELNTFHPSSVLVTGFDIIFFWVARMIMLTLKFTQQVPFKQVYVHGLVRDQDGQKMSKSKGNVLDPLDLIDGIDLDALLHKRTHNMMQPQKAKAIAAQTRAHFPDGIAAYGTDALRFTFLSLASTGRDIKFDMQRMEGYRNFCNKLWNASRYVLMNTEGQDCGNQDDPIELSLADRWIISRLQQTEELAAKYFAEFRFDLLSSCLYEFIWNEYCDWYLELSKPVLWDANASAASLRGTRRTLVRVLEVILRLAHPLMPYITEELWQKIAPLAGRQGPSIMLQDYPIANPGNVDPQAVEDIEWLKAVILCIRSIRSEMNLSPATHIPLLLCNTSADDERKVHSMQQLLSKMAKIDSINLITAQDAPMATTGLVGDLQLMVPMQGLIDKESELKRLNKEIDKLNQDIQRLTTKLSNDKFINKAPAEVVAKERDKLQDMRSAQEKLTIQKCRFEAL